MQLTTLGNVVSVRSGFAFKSKDWKNTGVPVIKIANVKDGFILLEGCSFVDETVAYSAAAFELHPGDILISMTGYIGEIAMVRDEGRMLLNQRVGKFKIKDPSKLNNNYLFYCLRDPNLKAKFAAHAYGAAQPNISPALIEQQEILLPPLPTQRKIAAILSAYDDLIENNTSRIKILENMAQSLYQEWFVKFRFPGYEQVAFEDSPLGKIPEGWEIGIVNDLLVLSSGFAFRSNTFSEDGTYGLVTIKNVHDGMFIPNCTSRISEPPENMPRYCYLSTGDILISLTGNIGRVCIVYGNDYLLNQRVAKLVPREQKNWAYIYCSFRHIDFQNRLCTIANGVAQQNLSPVATGNMQIAIPSKALLDSFSTISEPLIESIVKLFRINSILRETRDLLLPKLISGELDVSNLDISIPEEMSA